MYVCVSVCAQRLEVKLEYEYQVLALSGGSEDGAGLFFRQGHHTLSYTFTIKHTHANTLTQSHTVTSAGESICEIEMPLPTSRHLSRHSM